MENLKLFDVEVTSEKRESDSKSSSAHSEVRAPALNARALSSILVDLKVQKSEYRVSPQDAHGRLLDLLQSPAVSALLRAANDLAKQQGIQPEEALKSMLQNLRELDDLWGTVLMREGLARLSTQFH